MTSRFSPPSLDDQLIASRQSGIGFQPVAASGSCGNGENGPIRRGDLLVSARTPGYAMRADPERLRFGMVLGKALGGIAGPGRAVIPVLVNVK